METRENYNNNTDIISTPNSKQVRFYYSKRNKASVASDGQKKGARQSLPSFSCTAEHSAGLQIELGAYYEIDHKQLHPRSPSRLKSIRVVKVCEKSSVCLTVGFPSDCSLTNYLSRIRLRLRSTSSSSSSDRGEPEMDVKHVMSLNQASKILVKQVPLPVVYQERSMDNFWLLNNDPPSTQEEPNNVLGSCLLTLRSTADLRWGIRRKVKYVGWHDLALPPEPQDHEISEETSGMSEKNAIVSLVEEEEEEEDNDNEEEEVEEDYEGSEKEEENIRGEVERVKTKKRKRGSSSRVKRRRILKRCAKKEKRSTRPAVRDERQREGRWPAERYKSAEQSLLHVMRTMGANSERRIHRHDLREAARRFISDTGLLDHLLKHRAGEVLGEEDDGNERFVRRHNPDGVIEYWLEPAELAEIRRQADVNDPLWFPHARCGCHSHVALTLGSSDSHGQLKDDIFAHVKREMDEQMALKLTDQNEKMTQLQEKYETVVMQNEKMLEQNAKLHEQITALSVSLLSLKDMCVEKNKQHGEYHEKGKHQQQQLVRNKTDSEGRRISGFRQLRPEGTFLWPNMQANFAAAAANNNHNNNNNNNNPNPSSSLSNHNYNHNFNTGCPTPHSTSSATSAPSKAFLLPSPNSLPSPAAPYSSNHNMMMTIMGQLSRGDEMVLGTVPALETDSDDVLTDLALATISY